MYLISIFIHVFSASVSALKRASKAERWSYFWQDLSPVKYMTRTQGSGKLSKKWTSESSAKTPMKPQTCPNSHCGPPSAGPVYLRYLLGAFPGSHCSHGLNGPWRTQALPWKRLLSQAWVSGQRLHINTAHGEGWGRSRLWGKRRRHGEVATASCAQRWAGRSSEAFVMKKSHHTSRPRFFTGLESP